MHGFSRKVPHYTQAGTTFLSERNGLSYPKNISYSMQLITFKKEIFS